MNNEHTRRVYELSFYPHAYCIGRIPAETKLDPRECTDEMIKEIGVPERFGNLIKFRFPKRDSHIIDRPLFFLFWSAKRAEWVAFFVLDRPAADFVDETNYFYAHALDDKARRKLLEAFDISLTEELLKRVDKLSPTELEAMRDGG
ncbi:MAG: hypothetical protein A3C80_02610 [Candidatus Ryanbacteria bacterium RIFCSPHIGHO2_02_FULL_45_43]|nr:MAG: hypothetical protein A2718_01025 [Candidatus Ryanbacteria bacterium RIFCSPHIGHO2_01_FULL_44_130]OGZ47835.1 MAG: hypothetical protein A3C80_02610 [Candidatus Ryanbacteria bacterium RIFCSPHIGHO2_02_FULL_45_43]OGZ50990.1 MAG: hypothetical protein A3A17_03185 [Candidatus Ryanbacteria bacterium RIFCSPLOWO2_01_FULL_44_230]OGZ54199.1 MAG: hypothetical protein A3H62_01210 [Candidatus Ryanbacteria bacterium RIFCSPLOWO2_02_FULL_44_40]OGZ56089.1 MAG: hypothetical protein A3F85_01925 [Candidatus Ry